MMRKSLLRLTGSLVILGLAGSGAVLSHPGHDPLSQGSTHFASSPFHVSSFAAALAALVAAGYVLRQRARARSRAVTPPRKGVRQA